MKKCPNCDMMLEDDAVVCSACEHSFEEADNSGAEVAEAVTEDNNVTETVEEASTVEIAASSTVDSVSEETQSTSNAGEFECVKCGRKLNTAVERCACGGHAKSALPLQGYKAQKGIGTFDWIISVFLAPVVLLITFILMKTKGGKPTRKMEEYFSVSSMCCIVYLLIGVFYYASQYLSIFLAV